MRGKSQLAALQAILLLLSVNVRAAPAPQSSSAEGTGPVNSPAYVYYAELLKSGDEALGHSTYACFADNRKTKNFLTIEANLIDRKRIVVTTDEYRDGVLDDAGSGVFEGPLDAFSDGSTLLATLHSDMTSKADPSHAADVFEWGPSVLVMKSGFGKLLPGQVRWTEEFRMQRSTGRYVDHTVFAGVAGDGFTTDEAGKCIRLPNSVTPEEAYGDASH